MLVFIIFYKVTSPEWVERKSINAEVVEIFEPSDSKNKSILLVLKLPEGRTCKVFSGVNGKPRVGEMVPVFLDVYDDGSETCVIRNQGVTF